MKLFFCIVFIGVNTLFAQINQKDSLLSNYLINTFPYQSIVTKDCSNEFVGVFYISFKISKLGKCIDLAFEGLTDTLLKSAFIKILESKNLYFSNSFRKTVGNRLLVQPVYYSYSNCVSFSNEEVTNENDDCSIYKQTLKVIGLKYEQLFKDINKGFYFNKYQKGLFSGLILNTCIIEANPNIKKWIKV